MARYLLDASAIYPLALKLREKLLEYADRFAVLDLTIYEVGNAIWKEVRRGRIRNPTIVAKLFEEIFKSLTMLKLETHLREVLELAIAESLTFYDATYLFAARIHGLKLVTEDRDLLRFPEALDTDTLLKELEASTH